MEIVYIYIYRENISKLNKNRTLNQIEIVLLKKLLICLGFGYNFEYETNKPYT